MKLQVILKPLLYHRSLKHNNTLTLKYQIKMPITIHQEKQPNVDSNDEPQEQQSAGETANDEGQH